MALHLLVSCTSDNFQRYTRPVRLYIERTSISTDFDPRVLSSDGEGTTIGISYDLGVLIDGGPLTADAFTASLMAAIDRMQPSIAQNVSVGQNSTQEGASASRADAAAASQPVVAPTFIEPATPLDPKEHDDGWPSEAKIAAVAAALATVLAGWHKVRGLPFTKKRRDQKAFRHPAGH